MSEFQKMKNYQYIKFNLGKYTTHKTNKLYMQKLKETCLEM